MFRMIRNRRSIHNTDLHSIINIQELLIYIRRARINVRREVLIRQILQFQNAAVSKVANKPFRHVTQPKMCRRVDCKSVAVEVENVRPESTFQVGERHKVTPHPLATVWKWTWIWSGSEVRVVMPRSVWKVAFHPYG